MFKEHLKEEVVRSKTIAATDYICDYCNKRIYTIHNGQMSIGGNKIDYYEIITGHNDWGNDSIDSRETKHCCKSCLTTAFMQYKNSAERTVYNSEYIEINHVWGADAGVFKED